MTNTEPAWLHLDRVEKRFPGSRFALRRLTVDFPRGVTAVVGPNGAGKTTLLRILATVLKPTAGSVSWCGLGISADPVGYRDVIGYLPQDFVPYPEMTLRAFLAYVGAMKTIPSSLLTARIPEIIHLARLGAVDPETPCSRLSHGQKRRLGLAQALLNDPHVLILDEATSGLDPEGRLGILTLLREYAGGKVVVFSTHVLADAGQVADRILVLDAGQCTAEENLPAFVRRAQGHVFSGLVSFKEAAILRNVRGVALVSQVPAGADGYRVRLVVRDKATMRVIPGQLQATPPGPEDAYVYHRLLHRLSSRGERG